MFLVIRPLVERHAGDAAFYWHQRDQSAHSPLIDWQALSHFDRLLDAHLDGVRVARDAGWQLALQALERWRGAGEVFVCATLALEQGREDRLKAVIAAVRRDPVRALRGFVGAMLCLPAERMLELVEQWSRSEAPDLLQTLAWRALACHGGAEEDAARFQPGFAAALCHPSPHVRAAACRASPYLRQTGRLADSLRDEAGSVALEAAIASLRGGGSRQALTKLQAVVTGTASHFGKLGGYGLLRAQRRLNRWVRHLAISSTPASAGVEEMLERLPPRSKLQFILHHGDAAWLSWAQEQMYNPECARYAGWVWSALTGISLDANGLTPPIRTEGAGREYPTDDLDPGLPMPDARAVAGFGLSLPGGQRVLLGRTLDEPDFLHAILRRAPQALRWIAARHLAQRTGKEFNIRATARRQAEIMNGFSAQS
jgi:uncharacterized protein (TIGR02270 family)